MTLSLELILAGVILVSLTCYLLLAGADFGAGLWSMFAGGPRAAVQRGLIAKAIGPIWEANHVWLILVVTVLFTAFPGAFVIISIVLHVPLSLMLIGIVLRGSAFAFHSHDSSTGTVTDERLQTFWQRVFAISSLCTPIMLGITLGAIASGRVASPTGGFVEAFVSPWFVPFPLMVGGLTLALCACLAAVYLILETDDPDLQQDFRRRALLAAVGVDVLAVAVFFLAKNGAPEIWHGLAHSAWGRGALVSVGGLGLGVFLCLRGSRFRWARVFAVGQAIGLLWGWALAQFPYLVEPHVTIYNAAAPQKTLQLLLFSLLLGALLLFPSLYYLYRLFKGRAIFGETARS